MNNVAPHIQRVIDEKFELDIKVDALCKFIMANPLWGNIDIEERARMKLQLYFMQHYSGVLKERIDASK